MFTPPKTVASNATITTCLRENRRPAVLCELGFLSNAQDNRYVQSAQYRQRLAESVAAGIVAERQSAER